MVKLMIYLNGKIRTSRAKVVLNIIHEKIMDKVKKGEFESLDTDNYNDIWDLVDLWLYLDRKEHNKLALVGIVKDSFKGSNALLEYEEIKYFTGYNDIVMFSVVDFIINGVRANEFKYNKDSDIDKALFKMSIEVLNVFYDEEVINDLNADMDDYYRAIRNLNSILSEWRDIAIFRIRALAYGTYKGLSK